MSRYIIGLEIHIKRIEVAVVDLDSNSIVLGTHVKQFIDSQETLENLLNCWTETIEECLKLHGSDVDRIGIAIPGPFDYEKGISLMKNMGKFDALYGLNLKELLGDRLNKSPENIRTANTAPCFLQGEVAHGTCKGFNNILGLILSAGFGSARYVDGVASDADLWRVPFKNSIANTYFDIKWISDRYEEFTGIKTTDIKELIKLAKTDDGIGQLVFGEYGENFSTFLGEYVKRYNSDLVVVGGYYDAGDLFLPHVKDRLLDMRIDVKVKTAQLGNVAALFGAAYLWN
jgi:glucokinase